MYIINRYTDNLVIAIKRRRVERIVITRVDCITVALECVCRSVAQQGFREILSRAVIVEFHELRGRNLFSGKRKKKGSVPNRATLRSNKLKQQRSLQPVTAPVSPPLCARNTHSNFGNHQSSALSSVDTRGQPERATRPPCKFWWQNSNVLRKQCGYD